MKKISVLLFATTIMLASCTKQSLEPPPQLKVAKFSERANDLSFAAQKFSVAGSNPFYGNVTLPNGNIAEITATLSYTMKGLYTEGVLMLSGTWSYSGTATDIITGKVYALTGINSVKNVQTDKGEAETVFRSRGSYSLVPATGPTATVNFDTKFVYARDGTFKVLSSNETSAWN